MSVRHATLRLGVRAVPAPEAALVRALLKLLAGGADQSFGWSYAEEPPFDALIVDGTAASDPQLRSGARAVVSLTNARDAAPQGMDCLVRPLRADRLESWLQQTQATLAADPRRATAQTAARLRLKRWPPSQLLRADATRVRMATLLSRRALSAAELSDLAQCPRGESELFLQLLQGFGLLDVQNSEPVAAPAATRPVAAHAQWDLVRSIRRRLGLGGRA